MESLIEFQRQQIEALQKENAEMKAASPEMFKILNKILIHVDWSYENWTSNDGLIIEEEIKQLLTKITE